MSSELLAQLDNVLRAFGSIRVKNFESRFCKEKLLGKGSFGSAFLVRPTLCTDSSTPDVSAPREVLKQIDKARVSKNASSIQHVAVELAVTGLIKHPHLNKRTGLYHDDDTIFILLELCSGPRPDVETRVAHILAKRNPSALGDFDAIMAGLKEKAAAAGVDPARDGEEAFGDFVDRKECTVPGVPAKVSHIERVAMDCGVKKIDAGNWPEMPVGETLFNCIVAPRHLSDEHNRIITKQLCEGFVHLHGSNVVNRDMKPENCMVSVLRRAQLHRDKATNKVNRVIFFEKYHCSVIDFGLAKFMNLRGSADSPGSFLEAGAAAAEEDDPFNPKNVSNMEAPTNDLHERRAGQFGIASTNAGSHMYLSYDATLGILGAIGSSRDKWSTTVENLPKLDVWALGACAFAVANGTPPFKYSDQYRKLSSEEKLRQIRDAINRGLQFRPTSSAENRRFVSRLLQTDVTKRPSAAEALQDSYLAHNCSVVRTEIHASGSGNRCQMMREFPPEIAAAVLRDVSAAKRNDFPSFFLMPMVKAAFPPMVAQQQQQQQQQAAAAATAAGSDVKDFDVFGGEEDVQALADMANALRGMRLKEEGVDEDKKTN